MAETTPIAVLFGGGGFLGRHTARALAARGWRARIASRTPDKSILPDISAQIEYAAVDTGNPQSVAAALRGAAAVVNLVGILAPAKGQNFDQAHHQAAANIAAACSRNGIKHFVHVSAIGADPASPSLYARSKAAGETAVLSAIPDAVIIRPSIIFGAEDGFFNRFAAMARFSPALPLIVVGKTLFQPVFVDDVAAAIIQALDGKARPGAIYELGGPEQRSFADLLRYICATTGMRRALVPLPFPLAVGVAACIEAADAASFGLLPDIFLITRDQVKLLRRDNVVSAQAVADGRTLQGLGIAPQKIESIVPGYLGSGPE